jgi:hypothetical protein
MSECIVGSNAQSLQQFVNQSPWNEKPVLKLVKLVSNRFRIQQAVVQGHSMNASPNFACSWFWYRHIFKEQSIES